MLRILLIDDNANDRYLARHQLERVFSDLQIQEVAEPHEWEQAFNAGEFDLVITDYQLRWSDGLTVLRTLKKRYPDRPVIMFTNSGTQEIAVEAMKSGLEDYVLKSPNHYIRLPAAVNLALKRVETQRKVAGLETRLQNLLNQLDVGIYRLNLDDTVLEGNPAFLRLVGLSTCDPTAQNQTLASYFSPEDYAQLLAQLKQNGEVRDREVQLRRLDGTTIWVRISKTFSRLNDTTLIDGLIEDISDRKQFETQLRASEQRAYFLAEASRLLSASLDYPAALKNMAALAVPTLADWCVVDVVETNSATFTAPIVAAVDRQKEGLIVELRRRYPPAADADYGSAKVLRTGEPQLFTQITEEQLQQFAQDAEHLRLLRQLEVRSFLIVPLTLHDRKLGTIAFVSTQTDRRYSQADLEMAQSLAQRAALAIDNARLYESAQEANRVKDEFLAIVSHELRTPLNAMLGWSQLLRKKQVNEATVERALEIIERNAKLQNKLIDDILDISRIIQNRLRLNLQPVHLVPIINAAIEALQPIAQTKSIQIETLLDPLVGLVMGDAERLQQIVWNLVSNAIKFTAKGGQVSIRLEQIGTQAQVSVTDTGQGIPADFLPLVFERFRQADSSKTRSQGGLGLGLAIVRHLVEMHNGTVYATSEGDGRGATFTVQLPIHQIAPLLQSIETDPSSTNNLPNFNGLKILVVDDDLDSRELTAFVLEQCQAQIIKAVCAEEALQVLLKTEIDLLVSDVGMPDEDGYSLIRRIRTLNLEEKRQIPAVALTAFAKAEDQQEAIAAGFQHHVAKPVNPDQLIEIIASLANTAK